MKILNKKGQGITFFDNKIIYLIFDNKINDWLILVGQTEYDLYARHKLGVSSLKFNAWWQMYLVEFLKPGWQLERLFSIKSSRNLFVLKQKHIQIPLIQNNRIYHWNRTEGSFAKRIAFKNEIRCCWSLTYFCSLVLEPHLNNSDAQTRLSSQRLPYLKEHLILLIPHRVFIFYFIFFYLSFRYAIQAQIIVPIFKHSQMNEVKE